jgi:hypothetical protein
MYAGQNENSRSMKASNSAAPWVKVDSWMPVDEERPPLFYSRRLRPCSRIPSVELLTAFGHAGKKRQSWREIPICDFTLADTSNHF